jgi:hypothetical protein
MNANVANLSLLAGLAWLAQASAMVSVPAALVTVGALVIGLTMICSHGEPEGLNVFHQTESRW